MVLTEQNIKNIISEVFKKALLKEKIRSLIKESFEELDDYSMYEEEGEDVNGPKSDSDSDEDGRLADINTEDDRELEKRAQIEDFFKKAGVNNAPYAYELYRVKPVKGKDTNDMKNARKKFADNVNHAKNQMGYPYSFTSAEINKLQSMISNNELSEEKIKEIAKKTIQEILSKK